MSRVSDSRREVEARLADVRVAIDREVGIAPRGAGWVMALVAFSVGALAAGRVLRRRREKRLRKWDEVSSSDA